MYVVWMSVALCQVMFVYVKWCLCHNVFYLTLKMFKH
jgi:hypothetical protein